MPASDLSDARRLALLAPPPGPVRMVLDTDTANEIDDQFALTYALLSPERLRVEAVYAAPFQSERSPDPGDGMRQSLAEIGRLLPLLGRAPAGFAQVGSTSWLAGPYRPVASPAAEDLIARATGPEEAPLYVVAIGAPTNVASAILLAPGSSIASSWSGWATTPTPGPAPPSSISTRTCTPRACSSTPACPWCTYPAPTSPRSCAPPRRRWRAS